MRRSPMPEEKKKLARIPLPPKPAEEIHGDVSTLAAGVNTSERLMAKVSPSRRDPWIVPLAALVLAFSAISLIVECLVAFS
jgi:hypothetical protein